MTDKMTVLYINQTKHVLAALTHISDSDATLAADTIAGDGLLIRGFTPGANPKVTGNERFVVPPESLNVLNVDLNEAVFLNPRAFYADENQKMASPLPSNTVTSVVLASTKITVQLTTLPAVVPADTNVWVQIAGGSLTEP